MTVNIKKWTVADGIERTQKVLGNKATEYATDSDRYYNFRRIKEIFEAYYPEYKEHNFPLSMFARILQLKHTVSVLDMERDIKNGKEFSQEYIDEKKGDMTNYEFLIEGLIREENEAINE